MRRTNILWFDDDLRPLSDGRTPERARLQPWLRWLRTENRESDICVIEVRDVCEFAKLLQERESLGEKDVDYVDAFMIDLMWRHGSQPVENFAPVGVESLKILPMDAGAQLVGILTNKDSRVYQPPWLTRHADREIAVLTTITDHTSTLAKYIDPKPLSNICQILKETTITPDREHKATGKFVDWVMRIRSDTVRRVG